MFDNWNFVFENKTFFELMYSVQCQNFNCKKYVKVNIVDDKILKYGFICPHCKKITESEEMMNSLLKNRKNKT